MDWLEHFGAEHRRINGEVLDDGSSISVCLDPSGGDRLLFDDLDPAAVGVVWYRRWNHERNYQRVELLNDAGVAKGPDRLRLACAYHLTGELDALSQFLFGLFSEARWLGDPARDTPNKLLTLRHAAAVGLDVPRTLVTTDRAVAERFLEESGGAITKPIGDVTQFRFAQESYMMYTADCPASELSAGPPRWFPSLLQERIDKDYEIRAFYLAGRCHSMAIFSQGDERTGSDYRRYDARRPTRFVPFALPSEVEARLDRLMQRLDLDSGSIDLIRTPDGRYIFLEVNPIGQFGMISRPCNYNLERLVGAHLARMDARYDD